MSNELEYARLRKLLAAATQGPFSHRATPSGQHAVTSSLGDVLVSTFPPINAARDVVAIAAVMNAAPALLAELDRLRADNTQLAKECAALSQAADIAAATLEDFIYTEDWPSDETVEAVLATIKRAQENRGTRDMLDDAASLRAELAEAREAARTWEQEADRRSDRYVKAAVEADNLRAELAQAQQEGERLREYEQKWNALQEAVRKLSDLHERATRIANAPQMHPPVMLDAKAPPA